MVLEELTNSLKESTNQTPGCNTLIGFGDFNLLKLNWFSEGFPQAPGKSGNEHEVYKAFLEFAQDNFLLQQITSPTRGNNILDLVLTNNGNLLPTYKMIVNKQLSDHSTLVLQLAQCLEEEKQTLDKSSVYTTDILKHRIFQGDNKDWLRYTLLVDSIYWDSQTESQSIVQQVQTLSKTLEGIVNQCFPTWDAGAKKGNKIP